MAPREEMCQKFALSQIGVDVQNLPLRIFGMFCFAYPAHSTPPTISSACELLQ